ncbi:hypothetical protein ANANG_G00046690 [Anguilla anguilla]|uniref:Uncharacterized protein n=1 Tax=Anguilla anguilla TaxID=7936 RepID=A0A9D3MW46_ANGAN|nr:hypothetical protein ANANG_G00046690 [Anguilla anguilla]
MAMLKGQTLTLVSSHGVKKVEWKQGSFIGFGGDRSQNYNECTYKMGEGVLIPVYIQSDRSKPDRLKVDSKCQYGVQNGVIFLVIHDKSQTPYQHRFMMNPKQEWLKSAHDLQKQYTQVDMSWVAGDYLRDFE